MKVVWTPDAKNTYEQNIAYLADKWDEAVTGNFIEKIEEAVSYIQKNPALYPFYDKRKKVRKCVVVRQISLYYRLTETHIEILLCWNNYQDPKKLKLK
jgi:plasmid stabilization system protein ParE